MHPTKFTAVSPAKAGVQWVGVLSNIVRFARSYWWDWIPACAGNADLTIRFLWQRWWVSRSSFDGRAFQALLRMSARVRAPVPLSAHPEQHA